MKGVSCHAWLVRRTSHPSALRAHSTTPSHVPVRQETVKGGDAIAIPTNLAQNDDIAAMVNRTVEHFGGLDILVNNAAITFMGDLDQALHRHDLTMNVNYRAPFMAIREAFPHMERRGRGAIVNVSSYAALQPFPNMLSYGVSKIALEHLTRPCGSRSLHPKGIAVNCFRIDVPVASEGFVANTPGADRSRMGADASAGRRDCVDAASNLSHIRVVARVCTTFETESTSWSRVPERAFSGAATADGTLRGIMDRI